MEIPFDLGFILNAINLTYSFNLEEKVRDEIFNYLSNINIFYEEYDYDKIVNDIYSIFSSDKANYKDSLKLESFENLEEILRKRKVRIAVAFNSDILEYFNKSLYRSFIEGISKNWKENKNFKIKINQSTWSKFYSNLNLIDDVKSEIFICELKNWFAFNNASKFIDNVTKDEYSVFIWVKR